VSQAADYSTAGFDVKEEERAMRICFTLGDRTICIEIPVLLARSWRPPKPNGDPWRQLEHFAQEAGAHPDPSPWNGNIQIVATMAALAQHAQGDLKGRIEQLVHSETAEINRVLPDGAALTLAE
jgi:hypothetical protein